MSTYKINNITPAQKTKTVHPQKWITCLFFVFISFAYLPMLKAVPMLGLAKEAQITLSAADGRVTITQVYYLKNYGTTSSDIINDIALTDPIKDNFTNKGSVSNFNITITSADNTSIKKKNGQYNGGSTENMLATGAELLAGQSAVITLTYEVTMLATWNGSAISFTANTTGKTSTGTLIEDQSSNGKNPDFNNDGNPNNDESPTPININMINIDSVASITISENPSSTKEFIIKRVGAFGVSTVTVAFAPSGSNPATLGTAKANGIDAWSPQLTQTFTFLAGETQKKVSINIEDDDMYEPTETFTVALSNQSKDVSLLPGKSIIVVNITDDDDIPVVNISQNNPSYIWEGTGPGYNIFNIEVTLTNPSYLPVEVSWKVTPPSPTVFGTSSGTITFAPGTKIQYIPLPIIQDAIIEHDEQYTVHINVSQNASKGNQNFRFTLLDDDVRQIAWINNTPKSLTKRLEAGSGITDDLELHFKVVRGALDDPTVEIKLPAGITYVSFENIIDNSNTFGVTFVSLINNVLTFKVNKMHLEKDQIVHFKIKRKAECNATGPENQDVVRVLTPLDPNGVEEETKNINQAGKGARVKYALYNVYKGNLQMTWLEGSSLTFPKTEMGVAKKQAATIKNTGNGKLSTFDFYVQLTSDIGTLQNAKIRNTSRSLTFTGPMTTSGLDTYLITLSAADFKEIGNKDEIFDNNESLIIEFEFKSPPHLLCGPRKETLWMEWECQKPAATLNGNLSIFEPVGKPELIRSLKSPVDIVENGTPNNFVLTLYNKGLEDAYYVSIPFVLKGENEWINTSDVTVALDLGSPTYQVIPGLNSQSLTVTDLVIPAGKTATITFPVRREPLERYTATTTDMLAGGYFCYVECGPITYSDYCREPSKTVTIESAFFNSYNNAGINIGKQNTSYMPELMTADIVRIDMAENVTKTIYFEFGNLNTVFPMYDAQNWFGSQKNSIDSKVVITFNSTNNIQLDGAKIFINSNSVIDLSPNITQTGTQYIIEIPYNYTTADYFSKNGRVEMYIKGVCEPGGQSVLSHNLNYTVDFVTNAGVTHKFYKKTYPEVFVKCNPDPGIALKSLTVKRINYIKGDANNDGIDVNDPIDVTKINLDRFYHLDTLEIEYKIKIGRYYDCPPTTSQAWEYLYVTMGHLDENYFGHVESEYEIYANKQNIPYDTESKLALSGDDGNDKDSVYLQIIPNTGAFGYQDSVIVRSRWYVKTITGDQWEKSFQLNFWVHCEMNSQSGAQVFEPRPSNGCDEFSQNYEKEYANIQLYSLWHYSNGPQAYKYTFTNYNYKDIVYDYHLSIGASGYNNSNFLYELRQPYYTDSMSYTIPYGYLLVKNLTPAPLDGSIYFFGNSQTSTDRMYYEKYSYTPPVPYPLPEMQGVKKELGLKDLWDINIKNNHNTSLGQLADEGWQAKPFFTLRPTPRAGPGEKTVYVRLPYKSPTGLPEMVNTQAGFILDNDAATFILSCSQPEAIAYTDTVRWQVRVTNTSSLRDAKKGWIYIDGIDMEGVQLTTLDGTVVANSGEGYQSRWLWVGDIPANSYKDFILVAKYTKPHCTDDILNITPWHDYADIGDNPFIVNPPQQKFDYNTVPLDTTNVASSNTFDDHVGRSVELYVTNPMSEISGSITPLADTPKDPKNPTAGLFGSNTIQRDGTFPVEILVTSNDIKGVKNVSVTLNIPAGLSYVKDSAYYQWKGSVQKILQTTDDMLYASITGANDISLKLTLEELTGHLTPDILAGTYKTAEEDREFYLRFRLKAECTGLVTDSIILSATLHGERLCSDPAAGKREPATGDNPPSQEIKFIQRTLIPTRCTTIYPPRKVQYLACVIQITSSEPYRWNLPG